MLREGRARPVQLACPVGRKGVAIDGGNVRVRHLRAKRQLRGLTKNKKDQEKGGALLLRRRAGQEVG